MPAHPRLILLPGLDGTGELFQPLLPFISPELRPLVVRFPTDLRLGYDKLLHLLERELDRTDGSRLVLLGESFSGPLAVRYAAGHPDRIAAVILSTSFVTSPLPPMSMIPTPLIAAAFAVLPPPLAVLLGGRADESLRQRVRDAVGRVDPGVLAHRVGQVLRLDASPELLDSRAPLLCLRASDDELVLRHSSDEIASIRHDAVVRTIEGPHMLLQASPRPSWEHIYRFLAAVL